MASVAQWPRLRWATHEWVSRIPPELVSASVRRRHTGPYNAAVAPMIATLPVPVSTAATALAEEAAVEIARFDAELGGELAPFSAVLLRSESASSSMIENLTSGAKAIALAELGSTDKQNATLIVANVAAMRAALALADRLDPDAVLAMHRALMAGHDPDAGRWRAEQVWIGGDSYGPHGAAFVPPAHDDVPALIDDLIMFLGRTDLPVLIQAAIAHAQFETIHPFTDGNGRTGRALLQAFVRSRGLTRWVTVPISAGLLGDTASYFHALDAYRDGQPDVIVTALAGATLTAIVNGRQLVGRLRDIRAGWRDRVTARSDASAWRLADHLLRQPVIDATNVATHLGISAQNAQRAIRPLLDAGVLVEFTGHSRNRMWQSREVLDALDEFAARAARRR